MYWRVVAAPPEVLWWDRKLDGLDTSLVFVYPLGRRK